MTRSSDSPRIALINQYPGGAEDEAIRGVLDCLGDRSDWQFVSEGHLPFVPFDQVDLGAVDGVLGMFFEPEWAKAVVEAGVVAVDTGAMVDWPGLPRVANDYRAIGRIGGEHLLDKGFAHVGFISLGEWWNFDQERDGFDEIMAEAGRQVHACSQPLLAPDKRLAMTIDWLGEVPKPIGVMAAADFTAVHVAQAAAKLGLRVPDDVAVLGVGDDPWAETMAGVALSSVRVNKRKVGFRAAKLMDGLLAGEKHPAEQYVAPVGIVERQSTAIILSPDPLVAEALTFIRDHLAKGINVEGVVDAVGVSPATLGKRMKHATGREAIARMRIDQAKRLLITTDAKMAQIARQCGFRQASHFQRVFKQVANMTPAEYRRQRAL